MNHFESIYDSKHLEPFPCIKINMQENYVYWFELFWCVLNNSNELYTFWLVVACESGVRFNTPDTYDI